MSVASTTVTASATVAAGATITVVSAETATIMPAVVVAEWSVLFDKDGHHVTKRIIISSGVVVVIVVIRAAVVASCGHSLVRYHATSSIGVSAMQQEHAGEEEQDHAAQNVRHSRLHQKHEARNRQTTASNSGLVSASPEFAYPSTTSSEMSTLFHSRLRPADMLQT